MKLICAAAVFGVMGIDALTGGHLGLKNGFLCLLKSRETRPVIIAGMVSLVLLAVLLLSGFVSFADILELERLEMQMCPYCM